MRRFFLARALFSRAFVLIALIFFVCAFFLAALSSCAVYSNETGGAANPDSRIDGGNGNGNGGGGGGGGNGGDGGGGGTSAGKAAPPISPDLLGDTPYDENTRVVVSSAADVYAEPDIKSKRLTQALFNQPVELKETQGKWTRVSFYDDLGGSGWIKSDNLDDDWSCADDRLYDAQLVVTDREKAIMSGPKNGVVIRDVGMGVKLFVISKQDSLYEVAIPGDMSGWTLENGVFWLDVGNDVKTTNGATFATTAEKFRGAGYLVGGASFQGIDSAGLLSVAASINGVNLPRDLTGQANAGTLVGEGAGTPEGAFDGADTAGKAGTADAAASADLAGQTVFSETDSSKTSLAPGDALFFYASPADMTLADAGVYVGDDRFVHASQHSGKVQYDLLSDPFFAQRFAFSRRYFS